MKRVKRQPGSNTIAVTGCIASYPHLGEPRSAAVGAVPKYSVALILPADMDQDDWNALNGVIQEVMQLQWPTGAPQHTRMPINPVDAEKMPIYAGRYRLSTSSAAYTRKHPYRPDAPPLPPPPVVSWNPKIAANPADVYPGCGVAAYLICKAYTEGSPGVAFYINGIQITDPTAPRIDGRLAMDEVFEEVEAPTMMDMPPPAAVPGAPSVVSPTPNQPVPQAGPLPGPSQPAPGVAAPPGVQAAPVAPPMQPGPVQGQPGAYPGPGQPVQPVYTQPAQGQPVVPGPGQPVPPGPPGGPLS